MDVITLAIEDRITVGADHAQTFWIELFARLLGQLTDAEYEQRVIFLRSQRRKLPSAEHLVDACTLQALYRLGCVQRCDRSWQSNLLRRVRSPNENFLHGFEGCSFWSGEAAHW